MSRTCSNCKAYKGHPEWSGQCRLNPPTVAATGDTVWPTVDADDWCRRFHPAAPFEPPADPVVGQLLFNDPSGLVWCFLGSGGWHDLPADYPRENLRLDPNHQMVQFVYPEDR